MYCPTPPDRTTVQCTGCEHASACSQPVQVIPVQGIQDRDHIPGCPEQFLTFDGTCHCADVGLEEDE